MQAVEDLFRVQALPHPLLSCLRGLCHLNASSLRQLHTAQVHHRAVRHLQRLHHQVALALRARELTRRSR